MELKQRILNISRDAFFRKGLKSVTMDDIANALGVSKKTIYSEFKNKNEIVNNVVKIFLKEDEKACNCSIDDSENAIDEIFKLLETFKHTIGIINPVFMSDAFKYYPVAWKMYEDYRDGFFTKKIKENLIRGIQEGLYRKDLNIEIMARLKLLTIDSLFDGKTFPIPEFDFTEVGIEVTVHFLHGVCSLKGHSLINKYLKINE